MARDGMPDGGGRRQDGKTHSIEIDLKKAGLAAGRCLIRLAVHDDAGAATQAPGLAEAAGLKQRNKTPAEQVALLYAAALSETFKTVAAAAVDATTIGLDFTVTDLAVEDLDPAVFENPAPVPVWDAAGDALCGVIAARRGWPDASPRDPRVLKQAGRLPDQFVITVAAMVRRTSRDQAVGSDIRDQLKAMIGSDRLTAAARRAEAWLVYRDRVIGWPDDPGENPLFPGEFPLRCLYVPLAGYTLTPAPDGRGKHRAEVGELEDLIRDRIEDPDGAVSFVMGGPGAGKTTVARMLAADYALDPANRVVFAPIHHLNAPGDPLESIATFLGDPTKNPGAMAMVAGDADLVTATRAEGRRLILFCDGLDAVITLDDGHLDGAVDLAKALRRKISSPVQGDLLRPRAVLLGRDLAVQRAADPGTLEQAIHVAPLCLDQQTADEREWSKPVNDRRPRWWKKWCALYPPRAGLPPACFVREDQQPAYPNLDDPVLGITQYAGLNALLAKHLLRDLPNRTSRNDLIGQIIDHNFDVAAFYDTIIFRIFERQAVAAQNDKQPTLPAEPAVMVALMEDVALAAFESNTRMIRRDAIDRVIRRAKTAGDPAATAVAAARDHCLIRLVETPWLDGALTALYVRWSDTGGRAGFEFIHKSFADYLLARRLLRAAESITSDRADASDPLRGWAALFSRVDITGAVLDRLRQEADRRVATLAGPPLPERVRRLARLFATVLRDGFPLVDGLQPEGDCSASVAIAAARAELAMLAVLDGWGGVLARSETAAVWIGPGWPDRWALSRLLLRQQEMIETRPAGTPWEAVARRSLGRVLRLMDKPESDRTDGDPARAGDIGKRSWLNPRWPSLSNADLCGADFRAADLSDANLSGAKLCGADLKDADLRRADFSGADLGGANLSGANLEDAGLRYADLGSANLSGANLKDADLRQTNLRDANLRGADLSDATFDGADLRRANLRDADLCGASFEVADLDLQADLRYADLRGADLIGACLEDAMLDGAFFD